MTNINKKNDYLENVENALLDTAKNNNKEVLKFDKLDFEAFSLTCGTSMTDSPF